MRISIEINQSKKLALVLVITHLLLLAPIWLSDVMLVVKLGLSLLLLFCLWRTLRRYVWLEDAASIIKLWSKDHDWCLLNRSGEVVKGQLMPNSLVAPRLMILNFKIPGKRLVKSLIILQNASNDNACRRLRVKLYLQ